MVDLCVTLIGLRDMSWLGNVLSGVLVRVILEEISIRFWTWSNEDHPDQCAWASPSPLMAQMDRSRRKARSVCLLGWRWRGMSCPWTPEHLALDLHTQESQFLS